MTLAELLRGAWRRICPSLFWSMFLSVLLAAEGLPLAAQETPIPEASVSSASAAEPSAASETETTVPRLAAGSVVINELLIDPLGKNEPLEFIELYNPTNQPVDLSNWSFSAGVQFFFAPGLVLPAGGYGLIAQDPSLLQSRFGASALGQFVGKLANQGETVTLLNNYGEVIDEVSYGLGFPWPITGELNERSIQLINFTLDNNQANHWRSAPPTPGYANATWTDNPAPAITGVSHVPLAPTSADAIRVTATITDADGVASVQLAYQVVAPGSYIRVTDPAYQTHWTYLPMTLAGDGLYAVEMPPEARLHRHLVRYRVIAVDGGGRTSNVPHSDDPQPNFAYFVYDGAPAWSGAVRPGAGDWRGQVITYDFNAMRPLPVYHFIANRRDVEDAQFIPNSLRESGYMGDDYLWRGTLVYNGQVYDNIGFRARGGTHRYDVGKNMWKFNFNRGHGLQAYDDYGRPYPVLWDKLNFSAAIQNANRGHRGEQGLFESVGFRLFNLAGVPASNTHFVHFRVIDGAAEMGSNQYGGDFWGLYLGIQEVDGEFLDTYNLPDGNLYKMEDGTGELNNHGINAPGDKSDLNAFLGAYLYSRPDTTWWRANFDLPEYYSYRSLIEALHNYDINQEKNYLYYRNSDTLRWSILPWDLDLTWSDIMPGDGNEPFRDRVLNIPEFQIEYQNRLREVRDLIFNPDQVFRMIDEQAALINTPADGLAMVDADRAKWDFNPILIQDKYVDVTRGGHGEFYQQVRSRDFQGMVQLMKDWVVNRSNVIDQQMLSDVVLPATPSIIYVGPPGFPADQLHFQSSPFLDPYTGFAAMEWRVAEVMWPGLPGYTPGTPNRYEAEASWESGELTAFSDQLALPPGVCLPGRVCRARVRMKNRYGRWSHWSPPVEFVTGAPAQPPTTDLQISELMYHPTAPGAVPENDFEFVELYNSGATTIELTAFQLTGGISYTFASGAHIEPGAYLVVAKDAQWFQLTHGFAPHGVYQNRLNNSGERVLLVDAYGRTLVDLTYSDKEPWPVTAGGLGHSLVLNNPAGHPDPNLSSSWRASLFPGGSPGVDDPLPLLINEVLAHPAAGQVGLVEIYNPSEFAGSLRNWQLIDSANLAHPLPAVTLLPGEYWVGATTEFAQGLTLNQGGGDLVLASSAPGKVRPYRRRITYAVAPEGFSSGRYLTGAGQERFPVLAAPTFSAANAAPLVGSVVLSEVAYNAGDALEFVELTNTGFEPVTLYDPAQPAYTWRLGGLFFQFPSGVTIPAGGKIVVTSLDPNAICSDFVVADGVRVLGPLPLTIADTSQRLTVERPLLGNAGEVLYTITDEVAYTMFAPWPRSDEPGASLERLDLRGYGDDPLSWRRGGRENDVIRPAGATQLAVDLCSFEAAPNGENQLTVRWATRNETAVTGYHLWRSADGLRANAQQVTDAVVAAQGGGATTGSYQWVDSTATNDIRYTYWLVATGPNGEQIDIAFTAVRERVRQLHLPLVLR